MAEATGKDSGLPISELTLGEAESFLNSLMCLPEKPEGADEGEKGFVDQTKEFVAGFDEEKEKLLELQDHFNTLVGVVGTAGDFLSKYCLDADTAASACVVLSAASSVASLKIPDITTQKILMTVKKIEKGVDKILKTPLKTALENFQFILDAVETQNFEYAFEKLSILEEDAMKAFHYMDGDDNKISIENYSECAKAVKLHMFAIVLRTSYDRERKLFITPDKLQEKQVLLIGKALENIARKCIEQKKQVKTKSWGFEKDSIKSEAQNCLDQILNLAYPFISRARKYNDISRQLKMDEDHKFRLLPELLPVGHEDKTQMIVGIKTDDKGEKSTAKIFVFRTDTHVVFENGNKMYFKPIISEAEPVDMEDAKSGPLTISATGEARKKWSELLGDFTLTEELENDRPVYRSSDYYYLYTTESGAWAVDVNVGNSEPGYRSTDPAPSPALCQNWEYMDLNDGDKYKPGEITVQMKI